MIKVKSHQNLTNSINEELNKALEFVKKDTEIGFTRLPFQSENLEAAHKVAALLKTYEHVVVVGIGGSSMGPRAITEISSIYQSNSKNKISFIDNVDSIETEKVIESQKNLNQTAWLIISKSGSTIEVLWTLELIEKIYNQKQIPFWPNTFFITEFTDNPLRKQAKTHNRPCLEIPLNVGGRFSVLSPVGLVICEYLNESGADLLLGAKEALQSDSVILQCTQAYIDSFSRNENITLFWFYNSNFRWFGSWLQQLWAESLGKKSKINGDPAPAFSTPMISIGTCDQHSIMQQVVDGPKNKFVNIFRFSDVETSKYTIKQTSYPETSILKNLNFGELIKAEALATEEAFKISDVSTLSFEIKKCDSKTLGYLFMLYQLVVATIGRYSGINPFDQPGVALTKKLTLDYLRKINLN